MTNPNDAEIPEEILRSEQKPVRYQAPSVFGLPSLPDDITDLILKYGPLLVLAAGAYSGFSVVSMLILSTGNGGASGFQILGGLLSLASSAVMIASYIWLTQKRRIGWNALALALVISFLGQFISTGVASLLTAIVPVLVAAYIMLQVRDYYAK